ncbi:MAG: hypothetical protein JXR48_01250 [Candidatus Delongbacteria bacterium]|nr:hypothetical protein [Candidatus Delongbacteria bacterium]MBN2833570.1 hypothetical protein [Candidatus Delongbacteria bacterium]
METESKYIPVYSPLSEADYIVFISKLESMGIHFLVSNENIQNLFGVGIIGAGYNPLVGPIIIMVKEEDVEAVQEVLKVIE